MDTTLSALLGLPAEKRIFVLLQLIRKKEEEIESFQEMIEVAKEEIKKLDPDIATKINELFFTLEIADSQEVLKFGAASKIMEEKMTKELEVAHKRHNELQKLHNDLVVRQQMTENMNQSAKRELKQLQDNVGLVAQENKALKEKLSAAMQSEMATLKLVEEISRENDRLSGQVRKTERSNSSKSPGHGLTLDDYDVQFYGPLLIEKVHELECAGYVVYKAVPVSGNRKGAFFEYCMKKRLALPIFELVSSQQTGPTNHLVYTKFKFSANNIVSIAALTSSKSEAEQFICDFLMRDLGFEGQGSKADHYTARNRVTKEKRLKGQQRAFVKLNQEHGEGRTHALDDYAYEFNEHFVRKGYTPGLIVSIGLDLIEVTLSYWVNGYGLVQANKLLRKKLESLRLFGVIKNDYVFVTSRQPEGGRKIRKLILRAWRDYYAKQHGVSRTNFVPQMHKSKPSGSWFDDAFGNKSDAKPSEDEPGFIQKQMSAAIKKAAKDNADDFKEIGASISDGILDSLKDKMMSMTGSVTNMIEKQLGIAPVYIKAGVIFIVVSGVLLTGFTIAQFAMLARTIFEIKSFMSAEIPSFEGQGGDEPSESHITQLMVEGMATVMGKASGISMDGMVRTVNETSRWMVSLTNITTFLTSCWKLLKKGIDWIYSKITGYPFFEDSVLASRIMKDYEDFYDRIMRLDLNAVNTNKQLGIDFVNSFMNLQSSFRDVNKTTLEQGTLTRMQQILMLGYAKVIEVRTRLGVMKGRVQPIWINFFGPPKQGKSLLALEVPHALNSALGNPNLNPGQCWTRDQSDDFWSGYRPGIFCVNYEDLLQNKDVMLRTKTCNELILARNVSPYPLNMADLGAKGVTWFDTPLIMSTMNMDIRSQQNLGLTAPDALFRRVDFNVYIELKPGVSPRGMTISALTPEQIDDMDLYLVTEENNIPQGVLLSNPVKDFSVRGEKMNWEQFMEKVYNRYCYNQSVFNNSGKRIDWKSRFKFAMNQPGSNSPPPPPPPPVVPPSGPPPAGPPSAPPAPPVDNGNSSMAKTFDTFKQSLKDDWFRVINGFERPKIDTVTQTTTTTATTSITTTTTDVYSPLESTLRYVEATNTQFQPQGPSRFVTKFATGLAEFYRPFRDYMKSCEPGKPCSHLKSCAMSTVMFHEYLYSWYVGVKKGKNPDFKPPPSHCYYFWSSQVRTYLLSNDSQEHRRILDLMTCHEEYWWSEQRLHTVPDRDDPQFWTNFTSSPWSVVKRQFGEMKVAELFQTVGINRHQIPWLQFTSGIATDEFAKTYNRAFRKKLSVACFGITCLVKTIAEYSKKVPRCMIGMHINALSSKFIGNVQFNTDDVLARNAILECEQINALEEQAAKQADVKAGYRIMACYGLVAAITLGLAGLFTSLGFTGYFGQSGKYERQREQLSQYSKAKKGAKRDVKPTTFTKQAGDLDTLAANDPNADEIARIILGQHLRCVELVDPKVNKSVMAWVMMWKGNMGTSVLHVLDDMPNPLFAKFFFGDGKDEYSVHPIVSIKKDKDRDTAFFRFHGMDPVRDITKHLVNKPITEKRCGVARLSYDRGRDTITLGTFIEPLHGAIAYKDGTVVRDLLRVNGFPNQASDCAKPYMFFNPKEPLKIIGHHVAGNGSDCLVAPLRPEDFEDGNFAETPVYSDKMWSKQGQDPEIYFTFPEEKQHLPCMRHYATCSRQPPQPMHTTIQPTILNTGCNAIIDGRTVEFKPPWDVTEKPAKLRPFMKENGVTVNPHELAYRKLKGHVYPLPPPELTVDSSYKGCFSASTAHHWVRMLTIEEATFGVPELGIKSIDVTTSAGFPWVLKGIKRTDLINKDTRWIHPDLRAEVEYLVKETEAGRIVPAVFIHCLKDEVRPLERADAGYTRAFQIGSVQMLIYHRMSSMFWVAQTEEDQTSDISVGINVFSTHWDVTHAHITEYDADDPQHAEIEAKDISGWDLHYLFYFYVYIWLAVCNFYNIPPTSNHAKHLFAAFCQTMCGYVLAWDKRLFIANFMKSGSFLTSFLNSCLNSVIDRTCFVRLCRQQNLVLKYDDYVKSKKFGDDGISGIVKAIRTWFNCVTLAAMAKTMYNHDHTAPNKSSNMPEMFLIAEADYLCRRFIRDPDTHYIFAQLSMESIHSMVQYVHKHETMTKNQCMRVNMENALKELVYHGKEAYDEHLKVFNRFLRAVHLPPLLCSYEEDRRIMLLFKFG